MYLDDTGSRIEDPEILERIRALTIPPAWREVWICDEPLGHLQATGSDAAGRKQYLYHPRWREQRDRQKFHKMVRFAGALPDLRRRVAADLDGTDPTRERVLACAARLLDLGLFRIGSEQYGVQAGGLGLATIRSEHVSFAEAGRSMVFDYPAKSGVRRVQAIDDPACLELIRSLARRRSGGPELLAFREGRRWERLRSDDINEYLKRQMGEDFSAKDFRTWNATVLAALALAIDGRGAETKTARKRAIAGAVRGVAEMLGNTPAVAKRAYIDPRVVDRYLSGWTIAGAVEEIGNLDVPDEPTRERLEAAVLDLLARDTGSPAVMKIGA
ncbi:MAG: DNA topoisomerase IB [Solirubrobacteraceae bacterium]